jgi:hypothetical protein
VPIPDVSGVAVSLDYLGNYEAVLTDAAGLNTIKLCDGGGWTGTFSVANGETFVESVALCGSGVAADSGSLSAGAAAGVSITVILVVVAAAGVAFWFFRRRQSPGGVSEQLTGDQMVQTQTQDGGGYTEQTAGL